MANGPRNQIYLEDLRAEVHRDARLRHTTSGFFIDIPCEPCGKVVMDAFHMRSKIPCDQIRKKLTNGGWQFAKNKVAKCPTCVSLEATRPRNAAPFTMDTPPFLPTEETMPQAMTTEPALSPSEKARAARREALAWLSEAFNVEKGTYRAGVNDETIGKETGLAVEAVKTLREEFYGPLKVPTELEGLRADIANLRLEVGQDIEGIREHQSKTLVRVQGCIDAMERRVTAAIAKFAQ